MYKKIISVMSVTLVVFLCSFNVFAVSYPMTPTAKDVWYYYNNQDVSIEAYWTSYVSDPNYSYNGAYRYMFQNLLNISITNNTDTYQVADTNYIRVKLYTGVNDYYQKFYSNYDITSFTSNIVQPSIYFNNNTFYLGMYYAGPLVLAPNETVTIFVTLNQNTTPGAGGTYDWVDSNVARSTMTFSSTGTLELDQRPASFSPNTIEDLINNGYNLPPNIIAYIHSLYSQGEITNDLLQQILDSYNANITASNNLTNESSQASSTIDNQHQTESNYFSNSQTAIQDTGIQNFQFSSQELGGLNGLKDDFTAVWTACGSLSRYWIASLTIGLALAIIRHRRMFKSD